MAAVHRDSCRGGELAGGVRVIVIPLVSDLSETVPPPESAQ